MRSAKIPSAVVCEMGDDILGAYYRSSEFRALTRGRHPFSRTGEYDDVLVVQGATCLRWKEVSRIGDLQMKTLNRTAVDGVFEAYINYINYIDLEMNEKQAELVAIMAKCIACYCFRNTPIEAIHAGPFPFDPDGPEIVVREASGDTPWSSVGLLSHVELGGLVSVSSRRLFEVLPNLTNARFMNDLVSRHRGYVVKWDMPTSLVSSKGSTTLS
jgi:hypothetical protein